ncbi:MAG: DUF6454 family protein [Polaromonas sp.]
MIQAECCLGRGGHFLATKQDEIMYGIRARQLLFTLCGVIVTTLAGLAQAAGPDAIVSERVKQLTRGTQWRQVAAIPVSFDTQHPQGMVKIGDHFYVSSVEIRTPTKRFPQLQDGYDRDTGEGVGHLFKFDAAGNLLADLRLGEGSIYHPGGIDFDGRYIWVPVAEYRPNSRAIIYKVDPATMKAAEVVRYGDHIGGIVHNTDDKTLNGVSWGSRRFYRFTLDDQGRVSNADVVAEQLRKPNRSGYIDYQDCKYLGRREMLCSGLNNYQMKKDGPRFPLGGFEVVDLAANQAISQIPIELWTESGLPMTQNPFWIEATASGLRAYFMPEDGKSTLYIYEADVK